MKITILILVILLFSIGCSSSNETLTQSASNDSLLGIVWELENYTDDSGQIVAVADDTKYQFLFESQTSGVQVFIGCVNYSDSVYELNDGFLTIKLGASDAVVCNTDTDEFASQNNSITSLLRGGGTNGSVPLMYAVSNTLLTLDAADGRRLELKEVAELMQQK